MCYIVYILGFIVFFGMFYHSVYILLYWDFMLYWDMLQLYDLIRSSRYSLYLNTLVVFYVIWYTMIIYLAIHGVSLVFLESGHQGTLWSVTFLGSLFLAYIIKS